MTHPGTASQPRAASSQAAAPEPGEGCFDVAVLVEHELTGTAARRMVELYQMKSTPVRYNVVRSLSARAGRADASWTEAEQLLQKSLERLEALQANATGTVSEQPAVDALSNVVDSTQSSEVVVVTRRHWLDDLLHRDLASQARSRVQLPLVHLVDR